MICRNCGYELTKEQASEVTAQVEREYHYDENEHTVKVWCADCAVADRRCDKDEVHENFWWEIVF